MTVTSDAETAVICSPQPVLAERLVQSLITLSWLCVFLWKRSSLTNCVAPVLQDMYVFLLLSHGTFFSVITGGKKDKAHSVGETVSRSMTSPASSCSSSCSFNLFNCRCFTMLSCLLSVSREHIGSVYQSPFIPANNDTDTHTFTVHTSLTASDLKHMHSSNKRSRLCKTQNTNILLITILQLINCFHQQINMRRQTKHDHFWLNSSLTNWMYMNVVSL